MPVSIKQVKTAVASDATPLIQEVGKGYGVLVKVTWTSAELEELGIAIATLLAKVLNPIP